jgi:hypothetical protein
MEDKIMKQLLDLSKALRREIEIGEVLEKLRIELMEAKSDDDLNGIIVKHLMAFQKNPALYVHVASAKKRIDVMNKLQMKFWDNLN